MVLAMKILITIAGFIDNSCSAREIRHLGRDYPSLFLNVPAACTKHIHRAGKGSNSRFKVPALARLCGLYFLLKHLLNFLQLLLVSCFVIATVSVSSYGCDPFWIVPYGTDQFGLQSKLIKVILRMIMCHTW